MATALIRAPFGIPTRGNQITLYNEVLITLWWFRSPAYGTTTIMLVNGYNAQVYGITTIMLVNGYNAQVYGITTIMLVNGYNAQVYGITTIMLVNGYNAQVYGITTNVLINESNKHVPDKWQLVFHTAITLNLRQRNWCFIVSRWWWVRMLSSPDDGYFFLVHDRALHWRVRLPLHCQYITPKSFLRLNV